MKTGRQPPAVSNAAADLALTLTRAELIELVSEAVALALDETPRDGALLGAQELAQQLGVSVKTVRRMVLEGMPELRLIDSPRYELPAVLEWLRSRKAAAGQAPSGAEKAKQSREDVPPSQRDSAQAFQHAAGAVNDSAHLPASEVTT